MDFEKLGLIPFLWNIFGFIIYITIQVEATYHTDDYLLLNPCDVYNRWNVNYFGCALLTIIFNLLCPVLSIIYWICKFMKFICTVRRR